MCIHLCNNQLSISIDNHRGSILQVKDLDSGLRLMEVENQDLPPWRLHLLDPSTGIVQIWTSWDEFSVRTGHLAGDVQRADLVWQLAPGLEIRASVELPSDDLNANLHVQVHNRTQTTILQLEFPILRGIGRLTQSHPEGNLLLHPVAGGFLFVDPYHSFAELTPAGGLRHVPYPHGSGAFSQFMAYYAEGVGGFYYACHDPLNTAKEVDFYWSPEIASLEARFTHKSWHIQPGNSLLLEYPIVLGILEEGTWHDAAERYRAWATASGEGHPDWCGAGRLEERVARGRAARWLVEEVGFATFGLPSSFDVSPWLEAFHHVAERPVFHILGHDWPQWGGASVERLERLDAAFLEGGLKPYHAYPVGDIASGLMSLPLDALNTTEGHRRYFESLGGDWSHLAQERWGEIFAEVNRCGPWLPPATPPLPWFPTRFHSKNLETIRKNGDRFAPFLFDFFSYGHDVKKHGLIHSAPQDWQIANAENSAAFARIWMDPCAPFWQDFHAQRDRQLVAESGADGLYYDISAGCGPGWSDREDHGHPRGYGRWLWDGFAGTYQRSKEAAIAAKGDYVVQGVEMGTENLIQCVDFCQWRAGGLIQGDLEATPYLSLLKEGLAVKVPLFSYLYHEYGPVQLDGWSKLSKEFGDIFYLIAAQVVLQHGGLIELNYEYSPLERFPDMEGPTYQLVYNCAIWEERTPYEADPSKLEFLRELALARTGLARRYLAYGKAAKPVQFTTPIPDMFLSWNHYNSLGGRRESGHYLASAVVHQVWSHRDETLGLLFLNLQASRSLTVEFTLDPSKYGLRGESFSIWRSTREGTERLRDWDGESLINLPIHLPPRKIVLIEILPRGHISAL